MDEIFDKEDLLKLARWNMPFGKYKDTLLIDLPEAYLLWFKEKGFPEGKLGELMVLCLELKIQGIDGVVKPLKSKV